MRPGRFDAHIYLGLPDLAARKEILTILSKDVHVTYDVDFDKLARDTEGYTGAEIVQVYELATDPVLDRRTGSEATAAGDKRLGMADFETAIKQTPRQVSAETLAAYEAFRLPR
jgi:AAA family ATPase